MSARVEIYFDVVSPASYLAWAQLPKIAERAMAEIDWKPISLMGLFTTLGVKPPIANPAKAKYMVKDFQRCANAAGVPMSMNRHFPMNTAPIQRALEGWRHTDLFKPLLDTSFNAIWRDGANVADSATLDELLEKAGISADAFWSVANDPVNKELLQSHTQEAVDRGAFGTPTFFVGDEMFFGQDRLQFVEEALQKAG